MTSPPEQGHQPKPKTSKQPSRDQALEHIIKVATKHNITADEITARMISDQGARDKQSGRLIKVILTYLGGVFIFAGLTSLVGMFWDELGSAARVVVSFGPGLIALILGVSTLKDPRFTKASTPLFIISAALQPTGLFVFLSEYFEGDDAVLASIIVFGPMALQMGVLFWALRQTSLLFFTILFATAFFWAGLDKVGLDEDIIAVVLGLSGVMISYAANTTVYRAFTPFTYFVYAMLFAFGLFEVLENSFPLDMVLIGVAGVMIYSSVTAQSRSLLVAGVISMLGYLGYYTQEYFADMVGWPIALIVMGGAMIGISSYAVKLGQDITQRDT